MADDFDLIASRATKPFFYCVDCSLEKDDSEFYRRGNGSRYNYCKSCSSARVSSWRKANPLRNRQNIRSWTLANPEKSMIIRARNHARQRGIEFSISAEDLAIPVCCPILGTKLEWGSANKSNTPSIDRIDSRFGYTKGNVQIISWRANDLKGDASLMELLFLGIWAEKQVAT